jgi:polysaccharide export outer membrane protein
MNRKKLTSPGVFTSPRAALALSVCLCAASLAASAQVSLTVSSNLEQTAGTTSRGRSAALASGAHPDDFDKLHLDYGDTLQLSVFGAPEMTSTLQVDSLGDCLVPLVGTIHVQGDTPRQGEDKIRQSLIEKKMFNDPQVFLDIVSYTPHNITVSGEVQSPGKLEILVPKPLLDVLALAGGETPAAGGVISIHHRNADDTISVREITYSMKVNDSGSAASTLVYPGDTVNVRRAGVIYILGAVERPGGYLMVNGGNLTVPEAISLASGTTLVASTKTALVVSRRDGTIRRSEVPLDAEQRGKEPPTPLQDGDILYVITSKLKATLINTSSVLSSAASAGIYAAANH